MQPAIVLLEFDSIARGIAAGDAMAKRAPLATLHAGTVHPGKYLVLAGGEVADVQEAWAAGREAGGDSLLDQLFLPRIDGEVVAVLAAGREAGGEAAAALWVEEALGVIETRTVAAVLGAADAGVKGARVRLLEVRLADGLGGKGYLLFAGAVPDVEAAVAHGTASLAHPDLLVARVVIPQLHGEMRANLAAHGEFGARVRTYRPASGEPTS